jgi:hypothetical protein
MRRTSWLIPAVTPLAILLATGALPQASAAPATSHAAARPARAAGTAGGASQITGLKAGNPFCKRLGKHIQASSGAQMFCFGKQRPTGNQTRPFGVPEGPAASPNVDAARVAEDVSPAGVPAQGQSEVSIAASGSYVVEAWNDATGFVSNCGAPMSKGELTGFGFSADGGKSFTDLGGLPNGNCKRDRYFGDPSVAAYRVGGQTYFYIASLYDSFSGLGNSYIALDACKVIGSGPTASLGCGQPVIAGRSTQCEVFKFRVGPHKTRTFRFCSFLDKDFIAINPATGRLYVSYSDFLLTSLGDPEITSACDLGNRAGGTGPAGGTPAAPVCRDGTKLVKVRKHLLKAKPYFTVAGVDSKGCENEGAMPAVDPATGNLYVGYTFNAFTDQFGFAPCQTAAKADANVITKTPPRCLPVVRKVSPCRRPAARLGVPIVTMEATFVPGYNRFPSNSFPRLAVSDRYHSVSMVWDDARKHPMGDILMQSFGLNGLRPVQAKPVVIDQPHNSGLSFLPAVRGASADGKLDVSWYTRASVATSNTNVDAAVGVNPLTHTTPPNVRITDVASNWDNNSSFIVPNFGDYTDNAVSVTGTFPYVGTRLYVAWSDGRIGIPQPFEAHMPAG